MEVPLFTTEVLRAKLGPQRPTRQPSLHLRYTYALRAGYVALYGSGTYSTALHQTRFHPSIYLVSSSPRASAGAGQVQAPVQTQCRRPRGAPPGG